MTKLKGDRLPSLYDKTETIPYATATFRRNDQIPYGTALVSDSNYTRLVEVSLSTYLMWDGSDYMAREIGSYLHATPNKQDGTLWTIRSRWEGLEQLMKIVEGLFRQAVVINPTRRSFYTACERAKVTVQEYNELLDQVEQKLEEVNHAIAATLSPVR